MIRQFAEDRFEGWLLGEVRRSRERIRELQTTFPSASTLELANRLIDVKKRWAMTGGAVSGLFGLFSLPADLAFVSYLQMSIIVDVAVLCGRNVKSARARTELLSVFNHANSAVNVASRASPKASARIAERFLAARGFRFFGRAFPLLAAPVTVALNNRDLEKAAEEAMRYYSVIPKALVAKRAARHT
jgi:hypothetical protein